MSDEIIGVVEAFYRGYLDAFNREDTDALVTAFAFPSAVIIGDHGMLLLANPDDVRRFFDGATAALHARDWDRSGLDGLQVWPFSHALAMVIADIVRYAKDGSVFDRGRACYMVGSEGGSWKILTLTEMKPPYSQAQVVIG
jgi:hypothetical protein